MNYRDHVGHLADFSSIQHQLRPSDIVIDDTEANLIFTYLDWRNKAFDSLVLDSNDSLEIVSERNDGTS